MAEVHSSEGAHAEQDEEHSPEPRRLEAREEISSLPQTANSSAPPPAIISSVAGGAVEDDGTILPLSLFHMGSPKRIGESLRSAAAAHFPDAVDKIVREYRSHSHSLPLPDGGETHSLASEEDGISGGGGAPRRDDTEGSFTSSFSSTVTGHQPLGGGVAGPPSDARSTRSSSLLLSFSEGKKTLTHGGDSSGAAASSRWFSSATNASLPFLPGGAVEPPRKSYRSKCSIIGESGSGKSTFQHCFTHSMLKTLPEVPPSTSSGSSTYYFKSQTKREKLDMLVVDAGPSPLTCGIELVYDQTNLYILTMSLTGIKQRTSKRFLSFGNDPSAIVHEQDKRLIRSHIAKISSMRRSNWPNPNLVMVGTHKDLLTDQTREAVETVLRELNAVLTRALHEVTHPPNLVGCFAVSCVDHSCVPENRGGPRTLTELWTFLCEVCLKEAVQLKAVVGEPSSVTVEDIRSHLTFPFPAPAGRFSPVRPLLSPLNGANEFRAASERVITFVRRIKTELNFSVVHTKTLRQAAFSLGVYSKAHLNAILGALARDGEVLLFHQQPRHVGGREDSVVLWPHVAHKAIIALEKYRQCLCYPMMERARACPAGIDVEECAAADPRGLAAKGKFTPKLLVALSRCLPQTRRATVERAESFALTLLMVDFIFQRRCSDSTAEVGGVTTSAAQPVAVGSPAMRRSTSKQFAPDNSESETTISRPPALRVSVEYVAPSLASSKLASTTHAYFEQQLIPLATKNRLLLDCRLARHVRRTIHIRCCPVDVFPSLVCRWGPYITPRSAVCVDSVWLRRSDGATWNSSSSSTAPGQTSDDDDVMSIDGHATAQSRCLVIAKWVASQRPQLPKPSKADTVNDPEWNLDLHLLAFSSEDALSIAQFVSSLLRIACHMLELKFPGVSWDITGGRDEVTVPTTVSMSEDGDFVEVTTRELDEMFYESSS